MRRTSGLYTTCSYVIPVSSIHDELFIVPWSDIHHGHAQFCERTWKEFAYWGKHHPTAYYIGNGDYEDAFRATVRSHLEQNTEEEERVLIDEANLARLRKFESMMEFMRGRLIGVGDGNHDWVFADGRNTAQIIAEDFGCTYLGVMTTINITFQYKGVRLAMWYVQHHGGKSTARTAGGKFNQVEWMARSYDADIIATGDDHKKGITEAQTRIRFSKDNQGRILLKEYTPLLVRTGGCLKMLEPGCAGYQVDRNLSPLALGFNAVRVKLRRSDNSFRLRMGAYDIF